MNMEDYITDWNKLTDFQKEMAIDNYAAIREMEEDTPCDRKRAEMLAPCCCGWWVDTSDGYVMCNI